jgi:hypothetical protein
MDKLLTFFSSISRAFCFIALAFVDNWRMKGISPKNKFIIIVVVISSLVSIYTNVLVAPATHQPITPRFPIAPSDLGEHTAADVAVAAAIHHSSSLSHSGRKYNYTT